MAPYSYASDDPWMAQGEFATLEEAREHAQATLPAGTAYSITETTGPHAGEQIGRHVEDGKVPD